MAILKLIRDIVATCLHRTKELRKEKLNSNRMYLTLNILIERQLHLDSRNSSIMESTGDHRQWWKVLTSLTKMEQLHRPSFITKTCLEWSLQIRTLDTMIQSISRKLETHRTTSIKQWHKTMQLSRDIQNVWKVWEQILAIWILKIQCASLRSSLMQVLLMTEATQREKTNQASTYPPRISINTTIRKA